MMPSSPFVRGTPFFCSPLPDNTTSRRRCPSSSPVRVAPIFCSPFFSPRRHDAVEEEATRRRGGGEVALVPARSCDAIIFFPFFCSPSLTTRSRRHDDKEEARSSLVPARSCIAFFLPPFFLLPDDMKSRRRRHNAEEEARAPSSPPVHVTPFCCSPLFAPRQHDVEEEKT